LAGAIVGGVGIGICALLDLAEGDDLTDDTQDWLDDITEPSEDTRQFLEEEGICTNPDQFRGPQNFGQ
jgi:hypothetical protein